MKRFLVALSLVMAMCFSILPGAAFAAPAYQTPFSVSITYQNVGTGTATINVSFFAENSGTAQTFSAGTPSQISAHSRLLIGRFSSARLPGNCRRSKTSHSPVGGLGTLSRR